ncbi:MAG: ABC transporter ATP-binding protein, partial [Candidatus Neomarinimicrobiota bacterium]
MEGLRLDSLTKSYSGKKAVQSLSLQVKPGEIFGLLGPNGAG